MRKHQQRQILELLKMINDAQAEGQYADCQEGAIGIGEFIEQIEGEGTQTVALLEKYCELLFKASIGEVSDTRLDRQLGRIENSIKTELKPNRIEIAFLSYKASMSDSLESIYFAAKEDPDCDAYWIPIPYYDRKPDRSFGEMHYEGSECYSDKFDCTDWQEYDIEARHPDAIFTFNPYDAGNLVTSVHPDFYCERLQKLTDLLVYVPYFVSGVGVAEHYCMLAGCVFANMVILQSKSIRDTFVSVNENAYGNRYGNPEEKFVALGSPKFDKVINAKRDDFVLPKEWAKLITGKKVVLYNTSIGPTLKGDEKYLAKLRYVIDSFKNLDDVILWWRPHPLQEVTYESMRPQLLVKYKKIVADYKQANLGIYDNTTDSNRAIIWTDLYYGDSSSLLVLYLIAGKPAILQDIDVLSDLNIVNTATDEVSKAIEHISSERKRLAREKELLIKEFAPMESESYGLKTVISALVNATDGLCLDAESLKEFRSMFLASSDGTAGEKVYFAVRNEIQGKQ